MYHLVNHLEMCIMLLRGVIALWVKIKHLKMDNLRPLIGIVFFLYT